MKYVPWSVLGFIVVCGLLALGMWGCPQYTVWQQAKAGEAELRHAEFSRQVATQEAHAKMESAKMLAQAEIERAKGVAEANKIIGASLHENESYLRYLWIQSLDHSQHETIYIPTEGGLPILEANRRK